MVNDELSDDEAVQPTPGNVGNHELPLDETTPDERRPTIEVEQIPVNAVDDEPVHHSFDKEKRLLAEEANQFINSSHNLGRTRRKIRGNQAVTAEPTTNDT